MEIKREVYLERLKARKHNGFIKVITGIRRCGKSYLMNTLFYNSLISEGVDREHIIRFAFDSAEDLLRIGVNPLKLGRDGKVDPESFLKWLLPQLKEGEQYYLLLDEVQLMGAFEAVLNGFLRRNNLDVYVTGSSSRFLSRDIITEFAGRGDEVHVLPLSFSEYYAYCGGDKSDAYDEYSVYGGLPATALMTADEQKANYLITQMNNLYIRDIIQRYKLPEPSPVGDVLNVIASGISSLTNPRRLADTFASVMGRQVSDTTIERYICHLEDAFILNRVRRYDVKGRKYIGTPYKIYFEDVGLRNARLNFRQVEGTHIMENIIYNELRFRGYQVDVGVVDVTANHDSGTLRHLKSEVDFIATMGHCRYYIQSAYAIPDEEKYAQETLSFNNIRDSFRKIIIVEQSVKPHYTDEGYIIMGIRNFLLDKNSLNV